MRWEKAGCTEGPLVFSASTNPLLASIPAHDRHPASPLRDLGDFGSNPGALTGRFWLPSAVEGPIPLVVVLHGCTQTADAYDHGAGWSRLAQEQGFALLYPQQTRANNPNLCFNWFSPVDARRGSGEALSIRQMIAAMMQTYPIDRRRIYVTGLSAGGAMASIMLATYPEIFAAGAIIAGLPFGGVRSVNEAFARMRGEGYPGDAEMVRHILAASDHTGPWPRIAVWQGAADRTVDPSNAGRIVAQWLGVHGLTRRVPEYATIEGSRQRLWRNEAGHVAVEAWEIPGMGHGVPLRVDGPGGYGAAGPFMLEAGLSSTRLIAANWGLIGRDTARPHETGPLAEPPKVPAIKEGIKGVIEEALRKAGLMR